MVDIEGGEELKKSRDIQKKITNPFSHEELHVLVRLPLLRHFIHIERLLQDLGDSKNE